MRIVQINAVYEIGSTGRMTKQMHDFFREKGHESFVFCTNREQPEDNIFRVGDDMDHKVHKYCSYITGLQGYFSKAATQRLLTQIEAIGPEVVQLHNLHHNFINFELLFSYLAEKDIKTVITMHDLFFITGHCCYYTIANCDRWLHECGKCSQLHESNGSLFFDQTKRMLLDKKKWLRKIPRLGIVGNSQWTANQARMSFLRDTAEIERIYNWIDLNKFYPRNSELKRQALGGEGKHIILGIAKFWSEAKGIMIFKSLAERRPNDFFLLVGGKTDAYKNMMPQNVLFVGEANTQEEMAEYYSMADIFVNPSYQETFGNVTAEALSCGTPVIVNDATANSEFSYGGAKVNNNNIDEYNENIERLFTNGKSKWIEHCRSFAENNFDMTINLNKYLEFYMSL